MRRMIDKGWCEYVDIAMMEKYGNDLSHFVVGIMTDDSAIFVSVIDNFVIEKGVAYFPFRYEGYPIRVIGFKDND